LQTDEINNRPAVRRRIASPVNGPLFPNVETNGPPHAVNLIDGKNVVQRFQTRVRHNIPANTRSVTLRAIDVQTAARAIHNAIYLLEEDTFQPAAPLHELEASSFLWNPDSPTSSNSFFEEEFLVIM
jgi:hypothetical protein